MDGGIRVVGAEKQLFAIGMLVETPGVWFEQAAGGGGGRPSVMAAGPSLDPQKVEAGRKLLKDIEADISTSAATLDRLLGVR